MEQTWFDDDFILDGEAISSERRKNQIILIVGAFVGVVVLLAAFAAVIIPLVIGNNTTNQAEIGANGQIAGLSPSCDQQVSSAMNLLEQSCLSLGLDEVCYGNNTLTARLVEATSARFDARGDVIPVGVVQGLDAAPLNTASGEWGIAVFKTRAALPRTVPGQAVTFIIFGDTSVDLRGEMQAFYFSTGLGSVDCEAIEVDGILVQTPADSGTQFRVNGTDITTAGTVMLQAAPNNVMTVSMIDGVARVESGGLAQDIHSGQAVTVPLGGTSGLDATGAPSQPQIISTDAANTGCAVGGAGCASIAHTPSADETSAQIDAMLAEPTPFIDGLYNYANQISTPTPTHQGGSGGGGGYCGGACTDSSQCAGGMSCFAGICWNAQLCEGADAGSTSGGSGSTDSSAWQGGTTGSSTTTSGGGTTGGGSHGGDDGGDDDDDDDDDDHGHDRGGGNGGHDGHEKDPQGQRD